MVYTHDGIIPMILSMEIPHNACVSIEDLKGGTKKDVQWQSGRCNFNDKWANKMENTNSLMNSNYHG